MAYASVSHASLDNPFGDNFDDAFAFRTSPKVIPTSVKGVSKPAPKKAQLWVAEVRVYGVNGGLDMKYDPHSYPTILNGKLSRADFERYINKLNQAREPYRCTSVDLALLGVGLSLIPLVPFMMRKKSRANKRHKAEKFVFAEFEQEFPMYRMRRDRARHVTIIEPSPSYEAGNR
jgi:hypothetical protein